MLAMLVFLVRLGISVSARSQYLLRLPTLCWITGGHTIHPLLPPTGIEPTPFRKSASKLAGLHEHEVAESEIYEVLC